MLDYARLFGLDTVVFRHSSMYGGRQFATFDQGWIGWFCRKGLETRQGRLAEPFSISGNGKQVRDVLHADDMVSLYFRAIERIDRVRGQAFNIGGGMVNSLSLLELFDMLEQALGVTMSYTRLPPRDSDQRIFVADTTRVRECLDWEPVVDKATGIRRTLEWIEEDLGV
jgi:CDP-paratose 2-epimerase